MTVRFKSEYQKSYGGSRSRSVSPQHCAPLAGLRSDQMGMSREPGLQRRKRLAPGGLVQSCGCLLDPPDKQPIPRGQRTAPPAASKNCLSQRKESKPPTPLGDQSDPETPLGPRPAADPGPAAGPRPAADPGPAAGPRPAADPGLSEEPGAAEKSAKPSKADSHLRLSQPVTGAVGQQPSGNEVQQALRWRAGLRSGGHRLGGHRSEYHRQFSWKKPAAAASPILAAEQVLYSSSRSVPPFKKNAVTVETEYQRSFQGQVPPIGPRLRKNLEHRRVPLFHTHMTSRKGREESEKKPHPNTNTPTLQKEKATPPPQVQRGHRMLTEYQSSFRSLYRIPEEGGATDSGAAAQVMELRRQASSYRRRAWGMHFSRDHLSQLLSEHNALWEPAETTDSATNPPTPELTSDLCHGPERHSSPGVETLDLPSRSSRSSDLDSRKTGQNHTACGREEETDEEEGRLPTPRLKMLPVQRTHHDLTTPATGGVILVGKLKNDDASPSKQRPSHAVSIATGAETAVDRPVRLKEAWSENSPAHGSSCDASPGHRPAVSPPKNPIRSKSPSPVAPPPQAPHPHYIQGSLRHPDFQHNGELGLRFRELQCSGGGCGADDDDQLSVMSWRSAASCSVASAVLERAQKRRENFWGKR